MSTLKEFLTTQRPQLADTSEEAEARRSEWQAAIRRLMDQVKTWIAEVDPEGHYLTVEDELHRLDEARIGIYDAPGLSILMGTRRVRLVPIARFVAGPFSETNKRALIPTYGRVDMTDGLNRFLVLRERVEPDAWITIEQPGNRKEDFDQATFESHLESLLR